jgi:hypothetical protein
MAPRRVIEDSDEDDGGFGTPELLSPSVVNNEAGSVSMMQPSSTGKIRPHRSRCFVPQTKAL